MFWLELEAQFSKRPIQLSGVQFPGYNGSHSAQVSGVSLPLVSLKPELC